MAHKAGMIHAASFNVGFFGRLAAAMMPDVGLIHFVDGGIHAMATEALRPRVIVRLRTLAAFAEESGAQAILLTGTAFGRLVGDVSPSVGCPVLSVFDVVVDEALKHRGTIGVLGSHPGTLEGAADALRAEAAGQDTPIRIKTRLCSGAFEALMRDDWHSHNEIVRSNLLELAGEVDVLIAPQPSVEKAILETGETDWGVPVLTGAKLSIVLLKSTLE